MIGKISDCSVILSKNAESSKRVKSQNQAPMDHRSFNSFIIIQCCSSLPLSEMSSEICDIFAKLAYDLRKLAVRGIFLRAQLSKL
ncbi:unnamed protein product [Schistosoma curassoni]|uniref:Ovule protein n=1 Tax=Schistosoma curassoni TaxID=6186 RepID=A0A183JLI9_9TREM|nr:unnamed protein product [Schistosoma curassoni]